MFKTQRTRGHTDARQDASASENRLSKAHTVGKGNRAIEANLSQSVR